MKNRKGLTVIELLATIVILCLLVGFTALIALNVFRKAKDKSYVVTVTNIEDVANKYLIENASEYPFALFESDTDRYEYQCVTVQHLVDLGYLNSNVDKSKVAEDKYVKLSDYIFIKRNVDTKAVISITYLGEDLERVCDGALARYSEVKNVAYVEVLSQFDIPVISHSNTFNIYVKK